MAMLVMIILILLIGLAGVVLLLKLSTSPIDREKAKTILRRLMINEVKKSNDLTGAMVLIHSDQLNLHEVLEYEKDNPTEVRPCAPNQPFHVASIGKTFTAVLVAQLQERGQLQFSDKISTYLETELLNNLFVLDGKDYQSDVTIEHLLGHTSGVADYFEDASRNGKSASTLIITQQDHIWTPSELIDFTRKHQSAVYKPGEGFHYSDTGYILLGLIIEKITGKPFHQMLKEAIFIPLKMQHSYLMFYDEPMTQPKTPIAKIWFNGTEISTFKSLSIDWSGGGIVSTTEDLLKFMQALIAGRLVKPETLSQMNNFQHKFRTGIYYGLGMMQFRFEEFFPLLKSFPRMIGHMGILATHMFYADSHDAYIICNYGSDKHMPGSVKTIIRIVGILKRIDHSS